MLKASLNYKHVYAPKFRHNGVFQTSPNHSWKIFAPYGDRSAETLSGVALGRRIPSNVNFINIKNFSGAKYHPGALRKNNPVFDQIWQQYKAGKYP